MDVIALIHQRGEGQALVALPEPVEGVENIFGYGGRRVIRLLVEGQQYAVAAVDAGVGAVRVVRNEDIRHVRQADRLQPVKAQVQQDQAVQLLCGLEGISHIDQPVHAVLRHIARGHGKILRAEDGGYGFQRNDIVGVGCVVGILLGLGEFFGGFVQLLLCLRQLLPGVFDLARAAVELLFGGRQFCGGLGLFFIQRLLRFGQRGKLRFGGGEGRAVCAQVRPGGGRGADRGLQLLKLCLILRGLLVRRQGGQAVPQRVPRGHQRIVGFAQRDQLFQPVDGGVELRFALVNLLLRAFELGVCGGLALPQLLLACAEFALAGIQLRLPLCDLLLRVRQLLLGLCKFLVDGGANPLVQTVDLLLPDDHVYTLEHRAGEGDAGHALDALQLRQERFRHKVRQSDGIIPLPGDGGDVDGQHVGIDFEDDGRAGLLRPRGGKLIQLFAQVHGGGVHVGVARKLKHDHRVVFVGAGIHLLDAVQRSGRLFHGLCDRAFDFFRAGAGAGGNDDHIGKVDIGQQVRRHPCKGHRAQDNHENHRHENGHGFFYGKFSKHWHPPLCATGRA